MAKSDGGEKEVTEWRQGKSNILVCVRVRPLSDREMSSKYIVRVMDGRMVVALDPGRAANDVLRRNRSRERRFAFDHAFGVDVGQVDIYQKTARLLLDGVLNGYNATVFAYGATGAGKTFTMLGIPSRPGIMVLTLRDLFRKMAEAAEKGRLEFRVTLSYVEVYNENIRDLLSDSEEHLDLREDPIRGPVVAGVTEIEAHGSEDILSLLARGNRRRTQEPTAANQESSRSHAVLQVVVERKYKGGADDEVQIGKLSLVDLAGSERASRTENRGLRLREGANINRSLLALANCITALGQNSRGSFVNYRDSKLTRLLKDSLGGNCRTVMIANVSPSSSSFEETLNTLKYANRAKNIKTKAVQNVVQVDYHIAEYEHLITNLRGEIAALRHQLADNAETSSPAAPLDTSGFPRIESGKEASPTATGSRGRRASAPRERPKSSLGSTARLKSLRVSIVENFQERMQLQRSLIELEATNLKNKGEIGRRQVEIARWEHNHVGPRTGGTDSDTATPQSLRHVKSSKALVAELRQSLDHNASIRGDIEARLRENEDEALRIRHELDQFASSEERRELLDLQYRVGRLELENMELEHSKMLHDHTLRQKEMEIRKLKLQLKARDRLLDQQSSIITEHHLSHLVDFDAVAAVDSALEIDEEEEEEEEDDDDGNDDDDNDADTSSGIDLHLADAASADHASEGGESHELGRMDLEGGRVAKEAPRTRKMAGPTPTDSPLVGQSAPTGVVVVAKLVVRYFLL